MMIQPQNNAMRAVVDMCGHPACGKRARASARTRRRGDWLAARDAITHNPTPMPAMSKSDFAIPPHNTATAAAIPTRSMGRAARGERGSMSGYNISKVVGEETSVDAWVMGILCGADNWPYSAGLVYCERVNKARLNRLAVLRGEDP